MNETKQAPHLNWAGQPIRRGGVYGGRAELLPCEDRRDRREKITQNDLIEIFETVALTRVLAARKLESNTGASRAACYRALQPGGRFAKHLRFEGDMVGLRRCAT
jgi:hypothetical protein